MTRRLTAIGLMLLGLAIEGCAEPVPTVNMNVPDPGPQPPAKQGVIPLPNRNQKPVATNPGAL